MNKPKLTKYREYSIRLLDMSVQECRCKAKLGQNIFERLGLDPSIKIDDLLKTD